MAAQLGDDGLYRREGRAYFAAKAKWFRTWVWIFYTFVFPAIVLAAVALAAYLEVTRKQVPRYHKWYDMLVAAGTFLSLILYKVGVWLKK